MPKIRIEWLLASLLLLWGATGLSQLTLESGKNSQAKSKTKAATSPGTTKFDFEKHIAPLLSNQCVSCHNPAKSKGGLDLSKRQSALKGGASGPALKPGQPDQSPLWKMVQDNQMPPGKPLAADEKRLLREWIAAGAPWPDTLVLTAPNAKSAAPNWLRRLTVPEYIETVRSATGVDIETEARRILPPDLRADGFSNTAYNLKADLAHIEAYARLAEMIVQRLDVAAFVAPYAKSRELSDANLRIFIADIGKWLLRGPLDEQEVNAFLGVAKSVIKEGGDFNEAARYVIEAMLQAPRFIYRIETQRGDGKVQRLNNYELASRLSYILWGGPPDKELMRAAEAGELSERNRVLAQTRRLLQDPRAVRRSLQFVHEWLDLDRLSNMQPNQAKFPRWNQELAADMRAETLAFFEEIAWKQKRPLSEILNAQVTFLTPRLAQHYGFASQDKKDGVLTRYDLSSVPSRGGLLTQGSVLTIGGEGASMVARGLFVLHDLLDSEVGSPPPGVDNTPIPAKPGVSNRVAAEKRLANPACGGCHAKFEPLAFGLEKFDGVGTFREKDEHGNALREDGSVLLPGQNKPIAYKSTKELLDLLAQSDQVKRNLTRKLTQFALGRPLGAADEVHIEKIHAASQKEGGDYLSLMTAIVMSDLVQTMPTEKTP